MCLGWLAQHKGRVTCWLSGTAGAGLWLALWWLQGSLSAGEAGAVSCPGELCAGRERARDRLEWALAGTLHSELQQSVHPASAAFVSGLGDIWVTHGEGRPWASHLPGNGHLRTKDVWVLSTSYVLSRCHSNFLCVFNYIYLYENVIFKKFYNFEFIWDLKLCCF